VIRKKIIPLAPLARGSRLTSTSKIYRSKLKKRKRSACWRPLRLPYFAARPAELRGALFFFLLAKVPKKKQPSDSLKQEFRAKHYLKTQICSATRTYNPKSLNKSGVEGVVFHQV
jgi:hypothetical protein